MRPYLWLSSCMYCMNGLSTVVLGTVLPLLITHYGASYTLGGLFVVLQFIGYLIGVPASALIVRRHGHRIAIMLAGALIGTAETCIGFLPAPDIAIMMSCLNGIGLSLMQTTISTSMVEWFEGRRAVIMSRLEAAFGIGCLIIPLLESWLIAIHAWRIGFFIVGLIAFLFSTASLFIPIKPEERSNEGPRDAYTKVPHIAGSRAKRLFLSLFLFMIFLYVGVESCINNFFPAIFISYLGRSDSVASLSVTVFWMSMVIGRAMTGWAIRKVSYPQFLFWSIGSAFMFLMVLATWRDVNLAYIITFFMGLSMSGIFVVTMVYANHAFPQNGANVTRLVTIFAGIGGAVIPGLFGWLMDRLSVVQSLWTLAGFTILLLFTLTATVVMGRYRVPIADQITN